MTTLKTYRRRRKRQGQQENRRARFRRLWGDPRLLPPLNLDEPLRWTNYTATYRGLSIDVLVIDEDVTESFNATLKKTT